MTSVLQRQYDIAVAMKDIERRNFMIENHNYDVYADCTKCEDSKPLYCFYTQLGRGKTGIRPICIFCSKSAYRYGNNRSVSAKTKEINKLETEQLRLEIKLTDLKMIKIYEVQKTLVEAAKSKTKY